MSSKCRSKCVQAVPVSRESKFAPSSEYSKKMMNISSLGHAYIIPGQNEHFGLKTRTGVAHKKVTRSNNDNIFRAHTVTVASNQLEQRTALQTSRASISTVSSQILMLAGLLFSNKLD